MSRSATAPKGVGKRSCTRAAPKTYATIEVKDASAVVIPYARQNFSPTQSPLGRTPEQPQDTPVESPHDNAEMPPLLSGRGKPAHLSSGDGSKTRLHHPHSTPTTLNVAIRVAEPALRRGCHLSLSYSWQRFRETARLWARLMCERLRLFAPAPARQVNSKNAPWQRDCALGQHTVHWPRLRTTRYLCASLQHQTAVVSRLPPSTVPCSFTAPRGVASGQHYLHERRERGCSSRLHDLAIRLQQSRKQAMTSWPCPKSSSEMS